MKKKILIVGAGGHAKSVIDVIESTKKYQIIGLIDNDRKKKNKKVLNYKILGRDIDLKKIRKYCKLAVIAIGQIKTSQKRKNTFKLLKKLKFSLPVICSSRSYVSKNAKIKDGTVIFHNAIVNAGTKIGKNCIINTGSIIEHDSDIGDHCHVSTRAILNGGVILKSNSFIGSGAVIRQDITIGENCIISANTFLNKNLNNNKIFKP